jgi:hypothetical protein
MADPEAGRFSGIAKMHGGPNHSKTHFQAPQAGPNALFACLRPGTEAK